MGEESRKNKKDIAEGKQKTKRNENDWNKVSLIMSKECIINIEQGNIYRIALY